MRGLMGALMFAGLVAGCGGGMEDVQDDASLPTTSEAPAASPGEVQALACNNNTAYYARYYYSNGVECGLRYFFCDGREASRGCETTTYTEYYYCGCP